MWNSSLLAASVILLFGIHFNLNAQISIESSDVLIINTAVVNAYDTTRPTLNLGSAGSGQNWDFTMVSESYTDKDSVQSPIGTFGREYFSSANLAISDGDSQFVYIIRNLVELTLIGFSEIDSIGDTINQDFNLKIITFPSVLGTKFNSEGFGFSGTFEMGFDPDGPGSHPFVDSLRVTNTSKVLSEMDAEGTLKTLVGEYNALRQYIITYSTDSVFMYANGKWSLNSPLMDSIIGMDSVALDTSNSYRFWGEGVTFPVVEMDFDPSDGSIESFQWLKELTTVGSNELTHSQSNISIYPNPSRDYIFIQTDVQNISIEISDLQGRILRQEYGPQNNKIDVGQIDNGNYLLSVFDQNGFLIKSKLIQINH